MTETLQLILTCLAGGVLGLLFFGGLWWTTKKVVSMQHPALWFLSSLLLRMSIALSGFYLVAAGHWERIVSCLLGFVVARMVVTRWPLSTVESQTLTAKEASHAP